MKTKYYFVIIGLLVLSLLQSGGVVENEEVVRSDTVTVDTRTVQKTSVADINSLPLEDDASLYKDQDSASLERFYITVRGGTVADNTNHTFAEVNSFLNFQDMKNVQEIKTEVIFQVGDEYGPLPNEIGYGAVTSNATMNVRGRTSTGAPQKSYRIDLFDNAGLWHGQRSLALNKHPFDRTRLRNMLFFTLLQKVPGMTSLRTQFVQVFIKDETAGETTFTDFGLYTQVELPNGRYLRNHNLSRNGNLYKANMCEFYRYEDQIRLATDPLYNLTAFSEVLEPKTSEDHTKLIAMLDAVNNYTIPIEETIQEYFNIDNVTSFLAYNLLMGNPDSNSQNYLLYSPLNSDIWYFICWDGDGCLPYYEQTLFSEEEGRGDWKYGISNYWGVQLFNRMLRVAEYRQALVDKMEVLHAMITPELIASEIAKYRTVVDTFTQRMPDAINLNCTTEQLALLYQNIPNDVNITYQNFVDSLRKPMPFFLGDAVRNDGGIGLIWGEAYDFNAEFVHYTVQIATDWSFSPQAMVYDGNAQLQLEATVPMLPAGDYCWRVIAKNESGYTQTAFDWFISVDKEHYGMRRFTITPSGEVQNLP